MLWGDGGVGSVGGGLGWGRGCDQRPFAEVIEYIWSDHPLTKWSVTFVQCVSNSYPASESEDLPTPLNNPEIWNFLAMEIQGFVLKTRSPDFSLSNLAKVLAITYSWESGKDVSCFTLNLLQEDIFNFHNFPTNKEKYSWSPKLIIEYFCRTIFSKIFFEFGLTLVISFDRDHFWSGLNLCRMYLGPILMMIQ